MASILEDFSEVYELFGDCCGAGSDARCEICDIYEKINRYYEKHSEMNEEEHDRAVAEDIAKNKDDTHFIETASSLVY